MEKAKKAHPEEAKKKRGNGPPPTFMGCTLPLSVTESATVCGLCQLVAFVAQNLLQEYAFEYGAENNIKLGWAYAFCELSLCAFIPFVELAANQPGRAVLTDMLKVKTLFVYSAMAGLLLLSTGVANIALEHLNISTLVVFKSAKLVPVMLVGWMFFAKTFHKREIVAAGLLVFGVMNFVSADMKISPRFSMYGCLLACTALMGDALYPNVQEKMMKSTDYCGDTNAAQKQMLVATNAVGALASLSAIVMRPDWYELVIFFQTHPLFLALILLHGFLQYFGLYFYLMLIQRYTPRVAVTWATIRKGATVVVYFVALDKEFHPMYAVGCFAMLVGVLVEKRMI